MRKAFDKAFLGYNMGQVKRRISILQDEHRKQIEQLNEELKAQADKNNSLKDEIEEMKKYRISEVK